MLVNAGSRESDGKATSHGGIADNVKNGAGDALLGTAGTRPRYGDALRPADATKHQHAVLIGARPSDMRRLPAITGEKDTWIHLSILQF